MTPSNGSPFAWRILFFSAHEQPRSTSPEAKLKEAFPRAEVHVAVSAKAFRNALAEAPWDAVIASLPISEQATRQALLEWRSQNPEGALLILLSEGVRWSQALQLAPDDWLPLEEDWPARLPGVLRAALERARRRAMAHFMALLAEDAPIGLFVADAQGRFRALNPQLAAWLGQSLQNLRGQPLTDWVQTFHPPPLTQRLHRLDDPTRPLLLRLNGPQRHAPFQGWLWQPAPNAPIQGVIAPAVLTQALRPAQAVQQALLRTAEETPEARLRAALTALLRATEAQVAALHLKGFTNTPPRPDLLVLSEDTPSPPPPDALPCMPHALGWPQVPMRLQHAVLPDQRDREPAHHLAHWMVFPLQLGREPLGWLTLARTGDRPPFDELLFEATQNALGYLTALLEQQQQTDLRHRLETHLQRHVKALDALHELSAHLARAQTLTDLWEALADACQKMGWRFTILRLENEALRLIYHNFPAGVMQQVETRLRLDAMSIRITLEQAYLIQSAMGARRPLLQRLVWKNALAKIPWADEELIAWLIAILGLPQGEDIIFLLPLYLQNHLWGIIVLWGAPYLRPEDGEILDIMYHQLQAALETTTALERLRQRQRFHQALATLGARLAACGDEHCLAQTLLRVLIDNRGFARAAVYRHNAPHGLHLVAQRAPAFQSASYPPVLSLEGEASWLSQLTQPTPAHAESPLPDLQPEDVLVPLRAEGHLHGLLVVEIPFPSQEDLLWLNEVAEITAFTWQQRRLTQRLSQHLALHQALRTGLLALSQHLDTEQTTQMLLTHAMHLAHPQGVALWLVRPQQGTWQFFQKQGHFPQPLQPPAVPPHQLTLTAEPPPPGRPDYIPLISQGQVMGALEVYWASSPTPEARDMLTLLAAQGALMLANAQLFAQVQENAQRLDVLFKSTREIALAALDPEAVYHQVHQTLQQAGLEHDTFIIALYDPETQTLEVPYIVKGGVRYPDQRVSLHEDSLLKEVVRQRRTLLIQDFEEEHQTRGLPCQQVGQLMRSILAVPLLRQDEVIGVLSVQARRSGVYHEEHRQLLEALAAQVAVALENARLYAKTRQLSIIDSLTSLYNRRYLFSLGAREIQRARRFHHPLTAAMIDLDDFKQVNDTYGHHIGDEVLRQWAQRTRSLLREVDILGRYGGEEFGLFLPETPLEQALHLARRLRKQISETPFETQVGPVSLTVSIGLVAWNESITSPAALLQEADYAQYAAKHAGKNRIAWRDPETQELKVDT